MNNELYVLDTTIIIDNPEILYQVDKDIVIPSAVIKEIDGLKNNENDQVARAARDFARTLDRIGSWGDLVAGAKLSTGVRVFIATAYESIDDLASDADNRIVGTAIRLNQEGHAVTLLTTDTNMRTIARAHGVKAEFSHRYHISDAELERYKPKSSEDTHNPELNDSIQGTYKPSDRNTTNKSLKGADFVLAGAFTVGVLLGNISMIIITGFMGLFYAVLIRPPWAKLTATKGKLVYENIAQAPHELDPPLDGYGSYRHNSGYSTFHDD